MLPFHGSSYRSIDIIITIVYLYYFIARSNEDFLIVYLLLKHFCPVPIGPI